MPEIPNDVSFIKELKYCHIIVVAFRNPQNRLELGVWGYHNAEDALKRFEKIKKVHEDMGSDSPLISTETFMVGLYENYEQSLFVEQGKDNEKVM